MFAKRALSLEEQRRIVATAAALADVHARRDAAVMSALLASGCRVTEFALTNVADAVFAVKHRRLVIPKERRKGKSRDHVVLCTVALAEALQQLLDIHEEMLPNVADRSGLPLVVNRYGDRLSVRSFQKRVAYWAEKAGIARNVSPHWFRHSLGFNIMRTSQAADPRGVVKAHFGHADIRTSGEYTQPTEGEVLAALETATPAANIRKRDAAKAYRATVAA